MANNSAIITDNFKHVIPNAKVQSGDALDERNFIYARNPTFTVEAYLDYLKIIKPLAMRPVVQDSDAMLRLGFIPVIMPPSFWGEQAHTLILPKVQQYLPTHPRPTVSFISQFYNANLLDYWVSKMDAAKLCGCDPMQVTVSEVLKRCGV